MHHLTLMSYHRDEPVDPNDTNHPDGLLWPVHLTEIKDLPNGLAIEHIASGRTFTVGTMSMGEIDIAIPNRENGYTNYGIRGRREHEQIRRTATG